jgi:ketosteroid isomerase-like protein
MWSDIFYQQLLTDKESEVCLPMKEQVIEISKKFWKALEKADTATMRAQCDAKCYFVHIGGNCDLDKEMEAFDNKVFQPTEIKLNQQEVKEFGDTAIVITDCDYGLLLDGAPTTHHFAVTEVYQNQGEEWKLIQFTFTALVY